MPELEAPVGPPAFASFGGILEGPLGDEDALAAARDRLAAMRLAPALEIEGGRFSLMLTEGRISGERLGRDGQEALVDALRGVVVASGDPARVESTLRCRLEFDGSLVETVFRVRRGELEPVSRLREGSAPDAGEAPASRSNLRAVVVALALALAVTASAWQADLLGRAFAPAPSELVLDTAGFGDALTLVAERAFPDYRVVLRRGDGYPRTPEQRVELEAAADGALGRLFVDALDGASPVWVLVLDGEGAVVGGTPVELRALVLRDDGTVATRVRSGREAERVVLSLDALGPVPADDGGNG